VPPNSPDPIIVDTPPGASPVLVRQSPVYRQRLLGVKFLKILTLFFLCCLCFPVLILAGTFNGGTGTVIVTNSGSQTANVITNPTALCYSGTISGWFAAGLVTTSHNFCSLRFTGSGSSGYIALLDFASYASLTGDPTYTQAVSFGPACVENWGTGNLLLEGDVDSACTGGGSYCLLKCSVAMYESYLPGFSKLMPSFVNYTTVVPVNVQNSVTTTFAQPVSVAVAGQVNVNVQQIGGQSFNPAGVLPVNLQYINNFTIATPSDTGTLPISTAFNFATSHPRDLYINIDKINAQPPASTVIAGALPVDNAIDP